MNYHEDMDLTCVDCNTPFPFSASERAFFEEKGFTPPKRCRTCRAARKQGQGGNSNSGQDRSGARSGGGRSDDRTFYDATCADCGAKTQVPFEPKPGRDVFCKSCFRPRTTR